MGFGAEVDIIEPSELGLEARLGEIAHRGLHIPISKGKPGVAPIPPKSWKSPSLTALAERRLRVSPMICCSNLPPFRQQRPIQLLLWLRKCNSEFDCVYDAEVCAIATDLAEQLMLNRVPSGRTDRVWWQIVTESPMSSENFGNTDFQNRGRRKLPTFAELREAQQEVAFPIRREYMDD